MKQEMPKRLALALKLNPLHFVCEIEDGGVGILPLTAAQAQKLGAALFSLGCYYEQQAQTQGEQKPAVLPGFTATTGVKILPN